MSSIARKRAKRPADLSVAAGDRRSSLNSSWISRLQSNPISETAASPTPRLHRPTPFASDLAGGQRAVAVGIRENERLISTDDLLNRAIPISNLSSRFGAVRGDDFGGGESRVSGELGAGFGPFRIRGEREFGEKGVINFPHFRRLGRFGDEKWRKIGSCDVDGRNYDDCRVFCSSEKSAGVKLSPFFQVQKSPDYCGLWSHRAMAKAGNAKINRNNGYESRIASSATYCRTEKILSDFPYPRPSPPLNGLSWQPSSYMHDIAMTQDSAYFSGRDDFAPRTFLNDIKI